MPRVNNDLAVDMIRERRPFDNNQSTMGGRSTFKGWGDLPPEHRPIGGPEAIAYWVYSYDTPIAWVAHDGTGMVPAVVLPLPATATHQMLAARALGATLNFTREALR
jgi:hypothetical protein